MLSDETTTCLTIENKINQQKAKFTSVITALFFVFVPNGESLIIKRKSVNRDENKKLSLQSARKVDSTLLWLFRCGSFDTLSLLNFL
jgi:hypothetical protein